MTVAIVLDFPGATRQQYDSVIDRMQLGGRAPSGCLMHFAGTFGGGWRVIDLWEDLATFERFRDEQIMPHTHAVEMEPPSSVRVLHVEEDKGGSGEPSSLVQCVTFPGLDREGFQAADEHVVRDGMPPGITFHVNGPLDEGWCVIDGWTSKEARDATVQSRIRPAFAAAGITGEPVFEDLIVEATLPGRATSRT